MAIEETVLPPTPSFSAMVFRRFFRTLLGGVLFVTPIAVLIFIVYKIYDLINGMVVEPLGARILPQQWAEADSWQRSVLEPTLTLAAVVAFLYLMGALLRFRLNRGVDWLINRIPGVSTIYSALRDVAGAMQGPQGLKKVDTVVLVPFPHADARMAGYLMNLTRSEQDGRKLACVYIPIGLFPPSGYTLVLPEEDIVYTDWPATETWKLLLSGGLTIPDKVPYEANSEKP